MDEKKSVDVHPLETPSPSASAPASTSGDLPSKRLLDYNDQRHIRKVERRLLFKIDVQVVTIALLCYGLSFLDRTNIGQARLNGLQGPTSILKTQHQYQVATSLTYVLYIIAEIPSNLVLKYASPRIWIPLLVFLWGIVTCLQGLATSTGGFYVARLFLGLAEAGILPGLALWLTFFYKPHELMFRQSIYFSGATLGGALSGLLSTVLGKIHHSHYKGWSWIFIIEGAFTAVVGFTFFFILPSGPKNLFWLTPEERELSLTRMETAFGEKITGVGADAATAQDAEAKAELKHEMIVTEEDDYVEPFRISEVWRAVSDPKNLTMAVIGFSMASGLYGMAFFSPSLIKDMNPTWGTIQSQLMSCPPYAVALVVSIALGVVSDKMRCRYPVALFSSLLGIIGFSMCYGVSTERTWVRYGGLIVITCGLYSLPAALLSWLASLNASHTKRAVGIALFIVFTNSGGLASVWMWPSQEAPRFKTGFLTNLILLVVVVVGLTLLEGLVLLDRRRKAAGKNDWMVEELRAEGYSEKRIRIDLGDRHPDFRIML